ncbi:permease prefix domain 1-containing protein [Desertivirga xinjiangensis]|uniref:permease prefix domain 1-containing protein n=1 Tax=Desertivirga xinjiangensis TaxID=539206 RepID=UPI00210B84EC|nr:permease prefix domain 1-containing protein [Pedobacter xinjiangensis]
MEKNSGFLFEEQFELWHNQVKDREGVTQADAEELKSHFLDIIDELTIAGLDEEEAFWVACKRMGRDFDWTTAYADVNKPLIQLKRSLIILAGVLAYFLLYYFINCSAKLLYVALIYNEANGYVAIDWISKYLIAIHLMVMVFVASIYFFERKTISFIESIELKPRHTVYLLLIAILLSILNTCLNPLTKTLVGYDRPLISHLYQVYLYFDYAFPFLICTSFAILYSKYYRAAKFII